MPLNVQHTVPDVQRQKATDARYMQQVEVNDAGKYALQACCSAAPAGVEVEAVFIRSAA
jgi:hypothetical protein